MLLSRIITGLKKTDAPTKQIHLLEQISIPKYMVPFLELLPWGEIRTPSPNKPTINEPYVLQKITPNKQSYSTFSTTSFIHSLYQCFPITHYLLHIPKGTTNTIHIQIPPYCHLSIVTNESHLTIIEETSPASFGASGVEIFAKDSTIRYTEAQHNIVEQLLFRHATLENSTIVWDIHLIHNNKVWHDITTHLFDSQATITGTYLGHKKEWLSMEYDITHHTGKSISHIHMHGAQYDQSHTHFVGQVDIKKTAPDSRTNVQEHCLLLSPQTSHETLPILEIETKEAEAFHSASTQSIDPEELFYLASRGIEESEAKKLIVQSFLERIYFSSPLVDQLRHIYLSSI